MYIEAISPQTDDSKGDHEKRSAFDVLEIVGGIEKVFPYTH